MGRYPKRIPNDCGITDSFNGRLPELKCLIFILSKVWEYGKSEKSRFIPYSDFMMLGKSFHRGSGYITECIYDAVTLNSKWLSEYVNVRIGKNGCFVEYTDFMTDITEDGGTNYYQIYIEDVSRFMTIFGLRMYLMYMRDRNRIAVDGTKTVTYTSEKFYEVTGCRDDKILYRNMKRSHNELMEITGVCIGISKHKKNNYWNITYSVADGCYDDSLEGE